MNVLEYNNHPFFEVENILKGHDIAVYIVNDTILKVRKRQLQISNIGQNSHLITHLEHNIL